jgi:hypothetical protein
MGVDSIRHDDPQMQALSALYQGGDFNPSTVKLFPAWLSRNATDAELVVSGLADMGTDYREWLRNRRGITGAVDYARRWRALLSSRLWLAFVRSMVLDPMWCVREQAARLRGHPVSLSMNLAEFTEPLASNHFFFLTPVANFALPETRIESLPNLMSQDDTLRSLGLGFVPSITPLGRSENRTAIATLYALGAPALVPWDV